MEIRGRELGDYRPTYFVAEIGICHNGSMDLVRTMMRRAKDAGCEAVKFQTRTVDRVYTPEELAAPREGPWGKTNGDLKRRLELSDEDYYQIGQLADELDIAWFSSPWDTASVERLAKFNPPAWKIASPMVGDSRLLNDVVRVSNSHDPILISNGMTTDEEFASAVNRIPFARPVIPMFCRSIYPCPPNKIHLHALPRLFDLSTVIGFSSHDTSNAAVLGAVALGARVIERHVTLSRLFAHDGWSDHSSATEFSTLKQLIAEVRELEAALGSRSKKTLLPEELASAAKLRRWV